MNCQQICKISRKDLTKVKTFQKVLGSYFFLKHPVHLHTWLRWPSNSVGILKRV